jgi:eukaryotic-like serine/threonine-protein kinase
MTAERWDRIERIFEEAALRPPTERADFLDAACGEDAALRAEVEALLAADPLADEFLERLGAEVVGPAMEGALAENDSLIGTRLGPYRIEAQVGRGGMGAVYRASRADGAFEQTVALKVVRRDLSPEMVARFYAERQILARLSHPNIGSIFDGGITDDGRPWLAMEFVEGQAITAYADEAKLSVSERLALFQTVCDAVAFAHRNLIVHRDLKPSNILVTPRGQVKLLDFGIAKLIDEDAAAGLTRVDNAVMTPEYAAPEQVRGEGVTVSTDVYALGVLLYELLTGRRPYRIPSRVRHEVERAILEDEPTRPSTAVQQAVPAGATTGDGTPEVLSAARRVDPGTLRRRLAGDLDVIVLKALRKDADRRYGSAEAFAHDVQAHLDGLPVSARPDTFAYRASRFVRRHRLAVFAAAVVLLSLVGGMGLALWQADRAAAEARRAEAEALRAAEEAEISNEITQFLVGLFAVSDPMEREGGATTADEMLRLGIERAEASLADRPRVRGHVLNVIGSVYVGQGRYEEAERLLRAALDLRLHHEGDQSLAAAESKVNLASLYFLQRREAEAEPLARLALDIREALLPDDHEDVVQSRNNLGLILWRTGNLDEAALLLEAAAGGWATVRGAESVERAQALNNLGLVHHSNESYAAAADTYREALRIYATTLEPGHASIGIGLMNLSKSLYQAEDPAGAETAILEAEAILAAAVGADHPATLSATIFLGQLLTWREAFVQAEGVLRPAHERLLGRYGPDFNTTRSASGALDALYAAWGRPEPASPAGES